MKIRLVSIPVGDQAKALKFYTETLGFVVKHDIPLGEGNRWLTLVSKEDPDGPELLLEPAINHFEPAKVYYKALYDAGIPCAQFNVENLDLEFEKLTGLGVTFTTNPTHIGTAKIAVLDDTCGNKVQLIEML